MKGCAEVNEPQCGSSFPVYSPLCTTTKKIKLFFFPLDSKTICVLRQNSTLFYAIIQANCCGHDA